MLQESGFGNELQVVNGVLKLRVGSEQLPAVTRTLVDRGLEVSAVIPRSSLEDYFLSLTEQAEHAGYVDSE